MDFKDVIGQREVIGSLERSLSEGRIGHAYIFSGPAGIGKKTIARIFAGLLLCDAPQNASVCGSCRPCLMMENGSNPDYHSIICEELSIGVDLIREIQSDVVLKPMYSKRKVYIVEEAEKMTEQAQNCLLKTFEEPPGYVVVILLTTNYDKLLETVRSRAQHIKFGKYTREQVCQVLMDRYGSDDGTLGLAADYSDGNIGTALELAGFGEFSKLRDQMLELLPRVAHGETKSILDFSSFMDNNKYNADMLFDIMLLYYRDLLVMSETGYEKMLINSDKKDIIFNNARKYSSNRLISNIEAIGAARRALKQNAGYQLVIDNLLIKLREER
ncbi:MAG: DNA polymerase III subunit [Clostridiaceae bacterium]|nr:DNA polymerase III subunit [Clostridiaceae bacterium]